MKFLADMGISPKTVIFLRELGHDALHLHEQHLDQLADSAILEKARQENRIVLTHDLDFGELLTLSSAPLPSVIIFRLRDMRSQMVNRYLSHIIEKYSSSLVDGSIMSVTEGRVRVRMLPL